MLLNDLEQTPTCRQRSPLFLLFYYLKTVAGERRTGDRKRKIQLSQHRWLCNALIPLCWRVTEGRGTDRKQSGITAVSEAAHQLGMFKIFPAGQTGLLTVGQSADTNRESAGSIGLRPWSAEAERPLPHCAASAGHKHIWIVRNLTGSVGRRTPENSLTWR